MRPGGRQKGTKNRRTIEAAEEARIAVENAKGAGKKLAKEVLEDFMHLFAQMAMAYQPATPGMIRPPGPKARAKGNEEKFQVYSKLTVDTAKALADFQSPKFRAIMVSAPAAEHGDGAPQITKDGNVLTIDDPIAAARVYARIMKSGAPG
jgi:hypothetical protein